MSLQAEIVEPVTPAPNFENGLYRRAEDSGYNSVTPGSIECSEMSNENIDPVIACNAAPEANKRDRRCKRFKCASAVAFNEQQSPMQRRALKRPYQEDANTSDLSLNSIPTPTSIIAKRIQRLGVDDDFDASVTQTSFNTEYSGSISMETYSCAISNPTTPVKSCPLRTIHNLCSVRRSPKKLNFACHSLPGELHVSQEKQPPSTAKTTFRPDQKVDIINMLYFKVCNMPALKKIFGYLTDEDVYNYSKVNSTCLQICRQVPEARMKKDNYKIYKTITKENNENKNIVRVTEIIQGEEFGKDLGPSLKDIHNIVNGHLAKPSPKRSPPTTPKTRRFKTYTKVIKHNY